MTILNKRSLLSALLVFFIGLSPERVFSQVNRWAAFGPVGGSVFHLAIDPRNSNTLYAVTGGVFKSTDGGANWTRILGLDSFAISVHVDPLNANNLYVTTNGKGVLRSTNAGMNWSELRIPLGDGSPILSGVFALAIDFHNSLTIYAGHGTGCQGPGCSASGGQGLFKSTDGGTTWKRTSLGPLMVYSLATDPQQSGVLFAGTREGPYRTTDGGETWRRITLEYESVAWDSPVAFDPGDSNTVYMGTAAGVFRSLDGGATWSSIWPFSYYNPAFKVAVDFLNPQMLYVFTFDGTFKIGRTGSEWEIVNPFAVVPFVWDLHNRGTVYATKAEGDENLLLKSTDNGSSWRRLYSGLVATDVSIAVDPQDADSLYAWSRNRLFKSIDGARHWEVVSSTPFLDDFVGITVDPHTSGVIYAHKRTGLYKSIDGGVSWSGAHNGLPTDSIREIELDPHEPGTVYATVRSRQNVSWHDFFKSTNGGATWTLIDGTGLPEIRRLIGFVVSPHKAQHLYASFYYPAGPELYTSTDAGGAWLKVPFPASGPVSFVDVAFDPQNPDTVYAVATCALFRSHDRGTNWTTVTPQLEGCIDSSRLFPESGSTLYAATQSGILKTTDGGARWTIESDIPRAAIFSFAIDHTTNRKYAAVPGGGVYATLDAAPQETPIPLLTLDSTGCIGRTWTLKVSGGESNAPIRLFGHSNGRDWEVHPWNRTNAVGVYEERGIFAGDSGGRHRLHVDVGGASSNDVPIQVFPCSP